MGEYERERQGIAGHPRLHQRRLRGGKEALRTEPHGAHVQPAGRLQDRHTGHPAPAGEVRRAQGTAGGSKARGAMSTAPARYDDTEINALELLGSDPDVRELASLERLRVMAAVAPRVRSLTEAQRAKKLRRESGAETTVGEVVDAQLARANIELDVLPIEGVCPCGCKTKATSGALRRATMRGLEWVCRREATRRFQARRTPEQRSASALLVQSALTPEQRANVALTLIERTRARNASLTPAQRSDIARHAASALTPEQRSEASRKANAARTPEQRLEASRKASAARHPR